MAARTRDIALLGMMGVGKSTVAEHLGGLMRRPVVSTDALVESSAGTTIPDIFAEHGEPRFRALEHEAVTGLATGGAEHRRIIDLGGGAVLDDRSVASLREHAVLVHLDASLSVLVSRLAEASVGRPLLFGTDLAEVLGRLVEERGERYEAVADVTVAADRAPAVVALEILRWAATQDDLLTVEVRDRYAAGHAPEADPNAPS